MLRKIFNIVSGRNNNILGVSTTYKQALLRSIVEDIVADSVQIFQDILNVDKK